MIEFDTQLVQYYCDSHRGAVRRNIAHIDIPLQPLIVYCQLAITMYLGTLHFVILRTIDFNKMGRGSASEKQYGQSNFNLGIWFYLNS
jgi:hypothetical protein